MNLYNRYFNHRILAFVEETLVYWKTFVIINWDNKFSTGGINMHHNIDYAYELMKVLDKMVIPGINIKTGMHNFKYYAGINLEELKDLGLINEDTSFFQFNYHIAAFEEYFGDEGYRLTIHARGDDLETKNNSLFDEVYLPEDFNLYRIINDFKEQHLQELSEALYARLKNTPFINLPQPRIITIPEKDWQKIDQLAANNNLTLSEYLRKKALE
jgi:hypothetical protein